MGKPTPWRSTNLKAGSVAPFPWEDMGARRFARANVENDMLGGASGSGRGGSGGATANGGTSNGGSSNGGSSNGGTWNDSGGSAGEEPDGGIDSDGGIEPVPDAGGDFGPVNLVTNSDLEGASIRQLAVSETSWTELSSTFTMWTAEQCPNMTAVLLFAENADVGVQIYADDMVLIEQAP